ncbi:hypothetical protein DKX38_020460 [Salix brachista]|uniref:Uncharacterized protein n=1 Tax=Salix brachista TaxID=2182728 RepID=A0A5N5KB60_9ROSI|nr:hypothetical protein DKX38_020460 [Salix brachista]
MGSIAIRTICKPFLHGNLMRQTCIRDTESLSPRHRSSKTRVSYTLYKPSPSNPFSTSSSRSSFSNSKSRSGFIGWYLSQLESRPVVTKTFTTSLIYAAADLTAQVDPSLLTFLHGYTKHWIPGALIPIVSKYFAGKYDVTYMISSTSSSSLDFVRTLRMAGYGLLFLGPSQHLWFNFMSKVLPKRDVLTTFKKIFMGQAVYGPANTALFFSYNAALQGYREAVIGQFFIISHLYKSVEAKPEPSTDYQCLYLDQFGLMAGLHLFDSSESLTLSWMLLAAGILICESDDEIVARLKRDLLPTLRNGLLFWPACDFATYKFVPVPLQVHADPFLSYT